MSWEDRRLVKKLLRGDERAFDEFFERYFPGLYRFALVRMNHDADAAEEVAQATLCTVVRKLDTFRGEAALFTWLCTFCRHEISAYFKRERRQPSGVDLVEDGAEVRAALDSLWAVVGENPDDSLSRQELKRLVQVALDRLPGQYAYVLEWKYLEDLSVKEIATRLGATPKAVESMLTRARNAFRDGFTTLTRAQFDDMKAVQR